MDSAEQQFVTQLRASENSTQSNYFGKNKHIHVILERWAKVLDIIRYLAVELRIKDKEWGWKWRDTFLEQVTLEVEKLKEFDIRHDALDGDPRSPNYDPIKLIHKVMSDEFKMVLEAAHLEQLKVMEMHHDNLE